MDSLGHDHDHDHDHDQEPRHLDATTGREVVYCHACSYEWYRDDHGIVCPRCHGEITEIISLDSDPRFESPSVSVSPEATPYRHLDELDDAQDSDPDEADIEDHMGPYGFHFRRDTRDGSTGQRHHDPNLEPVLERFFGMIQSFAPTPGGPPNGAHYSEGVLRNSEPHVHRATWTTGNASVTIVSGPSPTLRRGASPGAGRRGDPFQSFFSSVMRDMVPPENSEAGSPRGGPEGTPPAFTRGLADILSLFNPANAISGDAVYSQEALDQIITNLMEAHPQSNAAPPASAEALADLERRPVSRSMLEVESKTECAICIDDMKQGDMAAFLPCKHWFHEECVVLWLKEHNTCPVCRASIENRGGCVHNAGGNRNDGGNSSSSQHSPSHHRRSAPDNYGSRSSSISIPGNRPAHISRPPSQSQTRLNEVLRSISSIAPERDRDRERERERDWGIPSGFSYDAGRVQRRNSLSPTSPRQSVAGDYRRMRQRSPSQAGNRREGRGAEPGRSSGSGPFGWFRDTFASRGNSNQDSNREER